MTTIELTCFICGAELCSESRTKNGAVALARSLHGWSQSKHGWLCNWHRGAFSQDAANDLAAAFERHTDLRPRREMTFFGQERDWRLDFAFVDKCLAIEVEGGVWSNGRHTRGGGFIRDIEKYNALTMAGWRLLRYTPQMIADDPLKVIAEIEHVLAFTQ